MNWTASEPTAPGWYWVRVVGTFRTELVRIHRERGHLWIRWPGTEVDGVFPPHGRVPAAWYGPLTPPAA